MMVPGSARIARIQRPYLRILRANRAAKHLVVATICLLFSLPGIAVAQAASSESSATIEEPVGSTIIFNLATNIITSMPITEYRSKPKSPQSTDQPAAAPRADINQFIGILGGSGENINADAFSANIYSLSRIKSRQIGEYISKDRELITNPAYFIRLNFNDRPQIPQYNINFGDIYVILKQFN